jgi:hypothetical protein
VDVVCLEEHGLAWLQLDIIEEEGDEKTNIVGELAVQSREQLSKRLATRCGRRLASCKALVLLLYLCKQLFCGSLDVLFLRVHQTTESILECLLQLGF